MKQREQKFRYLKERLIEKIIDKNIIKAAKTSVVRYLGRFFFCSKRQGGGIARKAHNMLLIDEILLNLTVKDDTFLGLFSGQVYYT